MADKNGIAQFLDKLAEGMGKMKEQSDSNSDMVNILPKPSTQEIGDGIIVWRWFSSGVVVEATLATRENNQSKIAVGKYVIAMKMPESDNAMYCLYEDSAKEIGQMLLSAYNWQNIWKLHAGDFLLEELSKQEPVEYAETVEAEEDFSV